MINFMDIVVRDPNYFCNGLFDVIKLLVNVVNILKWIIPIGLVLFGMLDLGKAVIAGKEDEMKKAQGTLIKRVIYALAIFLVVTIVLFVTGLVGSDDWHKCWTLATGGETAETNKKDPEGDFCSENPGDPECY